MRSTRSHWLDLSVAILVLGSLCPPVAIAQGLEPAEVASDLDALLATASGLPLPQQADDGVLLRRLYLDLAGRPPQVEELIEDLARDPGTRFDEVTDRLIASQEFAANLARYWRATILARPTEPRSAIAANSLEFYLTEAIENGMGWDAIARQLITAEGSVRDDGRTALIFAQSGKPEETVAEVSRIFLGIQIQCAQCHNHPTEPWTREQFHELAAFFPRVAARPVRGDGPIDFVVSVTDQASPRPQRSDNRFVGTTEHYMPDLDNPDAQGTLMTPTFFVNRQSLPLGILDEVRRNALADWVTEASNPWFSRALVNRMWAEWVGVGFYQSAVDDLGPSRGVVAEEALRRLADGFVASGHDLGWLAKTIMRTRAYRSVSQSPPASNPAHAVARSTARRLRSDQLFDQLQQVLGTTTDSQMGARDLGQPQRFNVNPRMQFATVFGFDPSLPVEEVNGSMTQVLMLMNGQQVQQALRSPQGAVARIHAAMPDHRALVERLYLHVLARFPTDAERATAVRYVAGHRNRMAATEDLAWALINSAEFIQRR
jgi:hypothetical protein